MTNCHFESPAGGESVKIFHLCCPWGGKSVKKYSFWGTGTEIVEWRTDSY